jgi:hypothetical protein
MLQASKHNDTGLRYLTDIEKSFLDKIDEIKQTKKY